MEKLRSTAINSAIFLKHLPLNWKLADAVGGIVVTSPAGRVTTITFDVYDQSHRHPHFDVLRFTVGGRTLRKRGSSTGVSSSRDTLRTEISIVRDEEEKYAEFIMAWLSSGVMPTTPTPLSSNQRPSPAYIWTEAADRNYQVIKALKGTKSLPVLEAAKHAQATVIDFQSILPLLNTETSVWEQFYAVLVAKFGASDECRELHNRTFVGDAAMDQLLSLQKRYLKKKGIIAAKAVSWSNVSSGPLTLYQGVELKGSEVFVKAAT